MRISSVHLFVGCLAAKLSLVSPFPSTSFIRPTNQPNIVKLQMAETTATVLRQMQNSTIDETSTMTVIAPLSSQQWQPLQVLRQVPSIDAFTSMIFGMKGNSEYQRGLVTVAFITLLFASNSPVLHAAFSSGLEPPVLLLNAAVSVVALAGLWLGGESLESNTQLPSSLQSMSMEEQEKLTLQAGAELGLWKFLATTANLYGLALTTAGHGALLIQLTTLIVPVVQGIQGVPIPQRIQASIVLALAGVVCYTQDPTGTPSATGDALCVLAAIFYATYDLRLFVWGKRVAPRNLITTKIGTQAILSIGLLVLLGSSETLHFLSQATPETWSSLLPVVLWSGVAVNAVAPFLQVGGQQAVGPTRCQTIYASQPLWAALMSYIWLGETIGAQGMVGGSAFLVALFLAATTEPPIEDCGKKNCEV
jgi:drug/metabolite transporter (DMT)-like permease